MKNILLAFLVLFLTSSVFSQNSTVPVPRLQKYDIGGGFAAYLPAEPAKDVSYSEDSSLVYTASSVFDDYHFEIISVAFSERMDNDELDVILQSYLDFLKTQFEVTKAAGYGKGHTLSTHPGSIGWIDFWEDKDGADYAVTGWVENRYLTVMFVWGDETYPYTNVKDMFFNGIRFPGDK